MALPLNPERYAQGRSAYYNPGTGNALRRLSTDAGGIPSTASFTVCGWSRINALPPGSNYAFFSTFSDSDTPPPYDTSGPFIDSAGSFRLYGSGANESSTILTVAARSVLFWAYTGSGTSWNGYGRVLGVERLASQPVTLNTALLDAPTTFLIGDRGGQLEGLDGSFWNVRAWDTVLSIEELMRESCSRVPVRQTGLHAWWPLEGNLNQTVLDWSGNRRHMTVRGSGKAGTTFLPTSNLVRRQARKVGSIGTLTVTEGRDTLSASGTTTIVGTFAVTEVNDTLSANGTTTVLGTFTPTEQRDTASVTGTTTIVGTFTVTEIDDSLSASGTTTIIGTFAGLETNDTLSATGTTTVLGTLAITLNNDTLVASGIVGTPPDVNTWRTLTNVGR